MPKKRISCPGGVVHIVIEEFQGIIQDPAVYCDEKNADKHYDRFVKEHWGSQKKHLYEREFGMPKHEIYQYNDMPVR